MKPFLKVGVLAGCLGVLVTSALASASIVGTWHGKMKIDTAKIHQPKTAAEKVKQVNMMKRHLAAQPVLVIRADHTFSITVPNDKAAPGLAGTWTQSGNAVTLDGKAGGNAVPGPKTLTLSADGKSLTTSHGGAAITFVR